MAKKYLKINGIPTHGFPKEKKVGDSGVSSFFAEQLMYTGIDITKDNLSDTSLCTADKTIYVENISKNEVKPGDDIFVGGLNGVGVFKVEKSDDNNLYLASSPYRTIDTTFRLPISYSFDNYAYVIKEDTKDVYRQAIVISDFNVSCSILRYIQIFEQVDGVAQYIEYKLDDSEENTKRNIIELTSDTEEKIIRLSKYSASTKKEKTIYIYGLYKVGYNSYKRIFLGKHNIYLLG